MISCRGSLGRPSGLGLPACPCPTIKEATFSSSAAAQLAAGEDSNSKQLAAVMIGDTSARN
ncbi:MAG: hypothetical protein WBM86_28885 [Waterburya sp.]